MLIELWVRLAQSEHLNDHVFDLSDHVVCTLDLAVPQICLNRVKLAHQFVVGIDPVGLLNGNHKIRLLAEILDGLDQVSAFFHDLLVDLDASLFIGLLAIGLAQGRRLTWLRGRW